MRKKGQYYKPPDGRLTSTRIRTWARLILKELDRPKSNLSQKERYRLLCRLEKLQDELAALEIEKTKAQMVELKRAEESKAVTS